MKRCVVIAMTSTALVAAGLAGCASDGPSTGNPAPRPSVLGGPGQTGSAQGRVTVAGEELNIDGPDDCLGMGRTLGVTIGDGADQVYVQMAVLDEDIEVSFVELGTVNGEALRSRPGLDYGAEADATKDGNTYTIAGTAIGVDAGDSVSKPFEIVVTCAPGSMPDAPSTIGRG